MYRRSNSVSRSFLFFRARFAHDLAAMDGLGLALGRRGVLVGAQIICGKRLGMCLVGVQGQQERWTFLNKTHPRMLVSMDAALVSFGQAKPTFQVQIV